MRYTDPTGEVIPAVVWGGVALGAGLMLLEELMRNDWNIRCVNWFMVGLGGAGGAFGGSYGYGLTKGLGNLHRLKNWSSASRKFKDRLGLRNVRDGSIETSHNIFFPANGNRGATWRNHFMNLRNLPIVLKNSSTRNFPRKLGILFPKRSPWQTSFVISPFCGTMFH